FEHGVREAQRSQVLRRFLSEVMVDPVQLLLGELLSQAVVEPARTLQVVPERFFDDEPRPAAFLRPVQARGAQAVDDVPVRGRWRGRVEQARRYVQAVQSFLQARETLAAGVVPL